MFDSFLVGKVNFYGIPAMDALPYIYDKCEKLHKDEQHKEIRDLVFFKAGVYYWLDGKFYVRVKHRVTELNALGNVAMDKYARQKEFTGDRSDFDFSPTSRKKVDLFEEFSTTVAREVVDLDSSKKKTLVKIADKWFAASDVQAMVDLIHIFTPDINNAKWFFLQRGNVCCLEAFFEKNKNDSIYILCTSFVIKQ